MQQRSPWLSTCPSPRLNPKAQVKKLPQGKCFLPRHVAGGDVDFSVASSSAMDWKCQCAPASNNQDNHSQYSLALGHQLIFRDSNTNSADFQVHHFPQLLPFLEILYICIREAGHHSFFSKLSHGLYRVVPIFEKSYGGSPCSLTSAIHMPCRKQKSSSTGMGCVDTSL